MSKFKIKFKNVFWGIKLVVRTGSGDARLSLSSAAKDYGVLNGTPDVFAYHYCKSLTVCSLSHSSVLVSL